MRFITNLKTNGLLIIKVVQNSNFMDFQGDLIKYKVILTSKIRVFLIDSNYEIPLMQLVNFLPPSVNKEVEPMCRIQDSVF